MTGTIDPSFPSSKLVAIGPDEVDITQYYTLEDLQMGDDSGTTETDSKTDPKGSGGYTTINAKGRSNSKTYNSRYV
jgi:hypothetical protein